MYLIFKRVNPYGVIAFDTLDNIKEATETEVYGKYNYDKTMILGSHNNYSDFTIIFNPTFPYKLCDDYKEMKNIILDVSNNSEIEYYLLVEQRSAHGVWTYPTIDETIYIFDDLKTMKEHCKSVQEKLHYLNGNEDDDIILDKKLIDEKIDELSNYKDNLYPSSIYEKKLNDWKIDDKTYNNISLEKFKLVQHYQENSFDFTIGNDFYVDFIVYKIKNNTYWK